jgi:hypothetical protein
MDPAFRNPAGAASSCFALWAQPMGQSMKGWGLGFGFWVWFGFGFGFKSKKASYQAFRGQMFLSRKPALGSLFTCISSIRNAI